MYNVSNMQHNNYYYYACTHKLLFEFARILLSYIWQETLEYAAEFMALSVSKFAEENNLQANVVKARKKLDAEKVRLHDFIYT